MDGLPSTVSDADIAQLRALACSDEGKLIHEKLKELGITKLGQRLKAIVELQKPPAPSQAAASSSPSPRVAFICHTGYFSGHTYGGATRASLSMLREARRICGSGGVDIIAAVQTPVPVSLVYKLEDDRLGELQWEGERVLVGRKDQLLQVLRDRAYDLVISFSIEEPLIHLSLGLTSILTYATPHNYYLPPFGPFKRFETRAGHIEMLSNLDALLSPCEHHCRYLKRWSPLPLVTRPLYAADYHYFHTDAPDSSEDDDDDLRLEDNAVDVSDAAAVEAPSTRREVVLPPAMSPWSPQHRFVTFVSPSPEKGLSIFLTLARRMRDVSFAAVVTQWTGSDTLNMLKPEPNVTVLAANPDVDVIFKQTKILIAPSVWQECCPLIVMESCLRGIPCVSSDVFGLPEANLNHELVVHTKLSYDHARGTLHHGVSNEELEGKLGKNPTLPASEVRAQSMRTATSEVATVEEVLPFERVLRRLIEDEEYLRSQSAICRERFYAFAKERENGLRRELESAASRRPKVNGKDDHPWNEALDYVVECGHTVVKLTQSDVQKDGGGGGGDDPSAEDNGAKGGFVAVNGRNTTRSDELDPRLERLSMSYKVVHSPIVFVRAAPAIDAEILTMMPAGMSFTVDARRGGWVRTAQSINPIGGGKRAQGWALVDGSSVGLGALLVAEA